MSIRRYIHPYKLGVMIIFQVYTVYIHVHAHVYTYFALHDTVGPLCVESHLFNGSISHASVLYTYSFQLSIFVCVRVCVRACMCVLWYNVCNGYCVPNSLFVCAMVQTNVKLFL